MKQSEGQQEWGKSQRTEKKVEMVWACDTKRRVLRKKKDDENVSTREEEGLRGNGSIE